MTLTAGSLFSGIGGLDLAAAWAGFDIRFQVELDEWRRKVLAKHAPQYWPNARSFKDIQEVHAQDLPPVAVLFGGFPCQDVSHAGKRSGMGKGTRSGLWSEFRRLVGDLRPRAVVVENVKGLLTLGGSGVIADLAQMGYVGRWGIISAADAGAPHLRERIFIVAYAIEDRQPRPGAQPRQVADSCQWSAPLYQSTHNGQWFDNSNPSLAGSRLRRTPSALADADGRGRPCTSGECPQPPIAWRRRYADRCAAQTGRTASHESRMGRTAHGLPARLDGFVGYPAYQNQPQYAYEPPRTVAPRTTANRTARVEALGDAVVPLQAYPIFYYLHELLQENRETC